MKKTQKIFVCGLDSRKSLLPALPAGFALSPRSDVQAQVDAVGKEAVSGNVLIWFLCAIGFLKVGTENRFFLC